MNRRADGSGTTRHTLPLSSRQVLGVGGLALELGVTCPRRGHYYAPLSDCLGCDACEGVVVGATEADSAVVCAPPDEELPLVSRADAVPPGAADEVTVAAILSPHVFCVRGDLSAEALGALLTERRIDSVPVVDALSRPIGVASRQDVLRWFTARGPSAGASSVDEIMTRVPYAIPANETVAKAAALMAFERLHALPVVAPSGQVIGVVSSHDVMAWVARTNGYVVDAHG